MFWQKKQDISEVYKDILLRMQDKIAGIEREVKDLREQIEKLEIKALESRKIYHKKLKNMFGEEKEESETNKNPSVFLSPNGSPI